MGAVKVVYPFSETLSVLPGFTIVSLNCPFSVLVLATTLPSLSIPLRPADMSSTPNSCARA